MSPERTAGQGDLMRVGAYLVTFDEVGANIEQKFTHARYRVQTMRLCCKNADDVVSSAPTLCEKSQGVAVMSHPSPFKWRHFESELILLCVRWYLRYSLSYRDLEEMMAERGLRVDHTTIYRWVQRYAPELDKRCRPHLCSLQRFLESGRDLHKSEESLDVSLSGYRF